MKKKLLLLITLFFAPTVLKSADLIKVGTYDFHELLVKMGEEPKLRERFPDALKENLFLPLMLKSKLDATRSPSKNSDWETKINDYIQLFTYQSLLKRKEDLSSSYQKSNSMKNSIVLGLTLAHQYRGFSIILKPEERILYSNTDLNKNIANTVADYDDTRKQALEEEKAVDEQKEGAE